MYMNLVHYHADILYQHFREVEVVCRISRMKVEMDKLLGTEKSYSQIQLFSNF